MFRNYFYLARNIKELNRLLQNAEIRDIYSQERDILFLDLILPDGKPETLKISADPQLPYILLKENHHKSKKNFIDFCASYLPIKLELFLISTSDRVVNIRTDKFDIFYILRGPATNVFFFFPDKTVLSFKKSGENKTREILNEALSGSFDLSGETLLNKISDSETVAKLREEIPQINKDILREYKIRTEEENDIELIRRLVREILEEDISVILFKSTYEVKLQPSNWSFDKTTPHEEKIFHDFQSALNERINLHYRYSGFNKELKSLEKFLENEIQFLSNKINNLRGRIEAGSKEKEYRKIARLLLANISRLKKGEDEIKLEDFEEGGIITIQLDKKLPPNKLVDKYFEKARDEKINFEKSKEILRQTLSQYEKRKEEFEELQKAEKLKDLLELKKKLKFADAKKEKSKLDEGIKYRRFLIDGKYYVYVGKDSASNDKLTLRFAKQNDYWFHARGLPGSHVVLRVENSKEAIPKSVLKKAASIAGYFSKGKTAKLVPVSYTFRKFVHKKKGMAPGKVLLTKENVLIVPPEIPKNCEEDYE